MSERAIAYLVENGTKKTPYGPATSYRWEPDPEAPSVAEVVEALRQFVEDTDYESKDSIVDVHDPIGGRVSRRTLHKARDMIDRLEGE